MIPTCNGWAHIVPLHGTKANALLLKNPPEVERCREQSICQIKKYLFLPDDFFMNSLKPLYQGKEKVYCNSFLCIGMVVQAVFMSGFSANRTRLQEFSDVHQWQALWRSRTTGFKTVEAQILFLKFLNHWSQRLIWRHTVKSAKLMGVSSL